MTATVTRWFTPTRSLAVALVSAGMGLGSVLIAPLSRWIITGYDWRVAMLAIGDLAWIVHHSHLPAGARPPAPADAAAPATGASPATTSPWHR